MNFYGYHEISYRHCSGLNIRSYRLMVLSMPVMPIVQHHSNCRLFCLKSKHLIPLTFPLQYPFSFRFFSSCGVFFIIINYKTLSVDVICNPIFKLVLVDVISMYIQLCLKCFYFNSNEAASSTGRYLSIKVGRKWW